MKLYDGGATAAGVALIYTIFVALVGGEQDETNRKNKEEIARLKAKTEEVVKIEELGHGPKVRTAEKQPFLIPEGTPNLPVLLTQFKAGDVIHIVPKTEPKLAEETSPKTQPSAVPAPTEKVTIKDAVVIEKAAPAPSSSPTPQGNVYIQKKQAPAVDRNPNPAPKPSTKPVDTSGLEEGLRKASERLKELAKEREKLRKREADHIKEPNGATSR